MLGKLIKAAISVALVTTGLQWLTGTGVFSATHKGSIWGRAFWRQKVAGNLAMFGLAYLSAKGSEDTTRQNLAIKSAGLNAIAARNIVYGKTRVGGTVVFRGTSGANNYQLHNVIALAGHEINDLKKIFIDAGSGLVELDISSDFASTTENSETVYRVTESAFVNTDNDNAYTSGSLIKVTIEKGDQTTSNGFAVANIGSSWTTDHKLQGIAYVYISCVFDVEKFTRYPEFSFEIEGKKVVDPRVHATNRTFSSNPALIIRDYLKDSTYGFGATDTEISDETSGAGFKQAANDCDDDITTTGSDTEDRFTLNGEFGSTEEPQRVLEHMLSSCGGQLNYNNGQFSLFVGKGRTAAGSITDDKVLAPVQITTKSSGMGSANGVKATYVRPSDNYIGGEITPYKDSTFLTEDTPSGESSPNYEKFLNLSFPYTHTTYTAQRLARMALNYGRQDQTLSVVVPIEFLSYQVGDVVNFTNERLGYDGKDFEITGMSFEFMNDKYLAVRLDLKEYNSAVFNTFTYVADPSLPTAPTAGDTSVAPPTSLTLTEFVKTGSVIKSADVFVKANWTNAVDEKIVKTVVMYKRLTDSNFDAVDVGYPNNHFHIKADTGTTYDVKVSHVSVAGISSAETAAVQITVGAEAVTLNTGTIGGITIAADKLYEGTGTFNNSNTGFYLDDDGQFSLKDKLSFNGTTLTVSGNLTVENTIDAGKITLDGQDLSALISASGSGTGGTFIHNTKISQFKWIDGTSTTHWGLFIDNTNAQGRLGIGTASNPTSAIHVYNTTPHIRLEDADTSEYVRIKGDDGNMVLEVDLAESDADSYLGIDIDNGERARFTSTGLSVTGSIVGSTTATIETGLNLESGTFTIKNATTDSNGLKISQESSDESRIYNHYNGSLTFGISNSEKMRLTSTGLGIGTSSLTGGNTLLDIHGSGSGVGANMAFANDHNTDKFYVGIAGDTTGDVLVYNAEDSDMIFATNNSERMRLMNDGKLGIGQSSPEEKLHVSGNILLDDGDPRLYFQTGSSHYNWKIAAQDSTNKGFEISSGAADGDANSDTYTPRIVIEADTGDVGIGTASPNEKLVVSGNASVTGAVQITSNTSTPSAGAALFRPASNTLAFVSNSNERMRIDSSGNVGIGTTSPYDKVEVSGAIAASGSTNANTSQGHVTSIDVASSRSRINAVDWGHEFKPFDIRASEITFGASSGSATEVARITSTGLGIGTTSPEQKLHIKDTSNPASPNGSVIIEGQRDGTANLLELRARDNSSTSSALPANQGGIIRMNGFDGSDFEEMAFIGYQAEATVADGDAPSRLIFGTTTDGSGLVSEKMRLDNAGRLGINTTSPSYKLHITAASDGINISGSSAFVRWNSGDMQIRNAGSYAMAFDTWTGSALTEKMRIMSDGRVGIGTTSPTSGQVLTVSGAATVLGTMTCTTISKISGSFKIDHPLKPKTHSLVHSFVESPQADNTYSGKLRLTKGQAELNLDEYFGMTEGTIVALNRDFRVFTTNESNWDNVKGSVKNNILYIESNNPESMAEVSWLVIGERQDKEIHESELTNDEGKIILEPSK